MEIYTTACFFLVAILITGVVFKVYQNNKKPKKRKEDHSTRQERAVWARAEVLASEAGAPGITGRSRATINFEIHLPGSEPYQGKATWLVDQTALEFLQPGKDVSVRIDRENPQYIYPHGNWASFVE